MITVLKTAPDAPLALLTCAERDVLQFARMEHRALDPVDAELRAFTGLPFQHLADIIGWLRQRHLVDARGVATERGLRALALVRPLSATETEKIRTDLERIAS